MTVSLTNALPNDMLGEILGRVGASSAEDFVSCICSCKAFLAVSRYHNVIRKLKLDDIFPAPWETIPENMAFLEECAEAKNPHALFVCGLTNFFFLKQTITGTDQLKHSATANHPYAMYLYGMILIHDNQLTEGGNLIKKLWNEQGYGVVRQCQKSLKSVVLEMTVRQYREYDMLLSQLDVGAACVVAAYDEVCNDCFIYKEIFRFIDYMHYV